MASLTPRIDSIEAGKNLLANGNFDIWQRGTSTNSITNFITDRWRYGGQVPGGFAVTQSRDTTVPSFLESGFQSTYSYKMTATTGSSFTTSQFYTLLYRMEGLDYAAIHGRRVRFQFWVKATKTGTMSVAFKNAASRSYITTVTVNSANTWEKKTVDLTMDDQGGLWVFDNTLALQIAVLVACGSTYQTSTVNQWQSNDVWAATTQTNFVSSNNDAVWFSQMSLTVGDFSSTSNLPFSRAGASFSDELAMCQRYCFNPNYPLTGGFNNAVRATFIGANQIDACFPLPVTMRVKPTLTATANTDIIVLSLAGGSQSGFSFSVNSLSGPSVAYISASKTTHGLSDAAMQWGTANGYLEAEL